MPMRMPCTSWASRGPTGRYDAPGVLSQAKRLSRLMLALPLEGAPLDTRRILMDLQRL